MTMDRKNIEACVREAVSSDRVQHPSGVLGVVTSYDRYANTASVVVTRPDTDEIEEVLHKVPCPVLLGIQTVAPTPGMPCYVVFKGGNRNQALITHFYNHNYDKHNYGNQNNADVSVPSYLLGM